MRTELLREQDQRLFLWLIFPSGRALLMHVSLDAKQTPHISKALEQPEGVKQCKSMFDWKMTRFPERPRPLP